MMHEIGQETAADHAMAAMRDKGIDARHLLTVSSMERALVRLVRAKRRGDIFDIGDTIDDVAELVTGGELP